MIKIHTFIPLLLVCFTSLLSAQITADVTPASGPNESNGAIVVSTSFGTQPYTFAWNNPSLSTNEAYNLQPGTYCVTVTDRTGCCSATACFDVGSECSQNCIIPEFTYDLSYDGCTINFTDISDVPPTGTIRRSWDFGDGAEYSTLTSSGTTPSHTYTKSGCYDVTFSILHNGVTTSTVKTICITSSGTTGPTSISCEINGPTIAGAGQPITLNGLGIGTGPFSYSWSIPSDLNSSNGLTASKVSVVLPADGENGDEFNFFVTVTDQFGNTSHCDQTVTLSGNIPVVEFQIATDYAAGTPTAVIADFDFTNQTGLTDYFFTIVSENGNGTSIDRPGCLNTWLPNNNCGFAEGLPEGNYQGCVSVKDEIGVYTNCKNFTIGNPQPYAASDLMALEPRGAPVVNPITGRYVSSPDAPFEFGVTGSHPFPGYFGCDGKDQYFIVLHIRDLSTNQTVDIGSIEDPMSFQSSQQYTHPFGLSYKNFTLGGAFDCVNTSVSITADVYAVPCGPNPEPPIANDLPQILYSITTPLVVEVMPLHPPTISSINVSNVCDRIISANGIMGCPITNIKWSAFDYATGEKIDDFFLGNTNSLSVLPDLSNPYYEQFSRGTLSKVRIDLEITDQNGFTGSKSQVILFPTPLRVNLPDVIVRCPGTIATLQTNGITVVEGGSGNYEVIWTQIQPNLPDILSCHDCENPLVTAYSSGTYPYHVQIQDLAWGCGYEQDITIKTQRIVIDITETNMIVCGSGPSINSKLAAPIVTGGTGNYKYSWTPQNYLVNANVPTPVLNIPVGINLAVFTLTVSDDLGCVSVAPETVTVTKQNNTNVNVFSLGADVTICHAEELLLEVIPASTSSPYYFEWTSNNPKLLGPVQTNTGLNLTWEHNNHNKTSPQTYSYIGKLVDPISGCYKEDEIKVTVNSAWKYNGYEPVTLFTVAGVKRNLWQPYSNNRITAPNPYSNDNPLTITWAPFDPETIELGGGNIGCQSPSNGMFIPTVEHPQLTMKVLHGPTGCAKEFKSVRYLIGDSKMDLTVTPSKTGIICQGQNICYDIRFDMHLLPNQSTVGIPQSVKVKYELKPPNGSNQILKRGILELPLKTALGQFMTNICFQNYFINEGNYTFSASIENPEQFGPQDWIEAFQAWNGVPEQITASVDLLVSDGYYPNWSPLGPITTCISPTYGTSINIGVGCSTVGMIGNSKVQIKARDYIEIHPEGMVTFVPENSNGLANSGLEGAHFMIDPCIPPARPEVIGRVEESTPQIENNIINKIYMEIQPNPFTDRVTIVYSISSENVNLKLSIFDFMGRLISDIEQIENIKPGAYSTEFSSEGLPSGVYFYHITLSNGLNITKKGIKI